MQGLPEIGDVLDDTYEITGQIGQGGFGAVYLARQISIDREVALKVLVAHAMKVDEMIQRFRREVMAVRNLSHPNTIRIYDFHDGADGVLYYSMEYVKGPTLKDVIKTGPMAPGRVRYIIRQVLKSLSEAHSYGIVHRDLKPANIMLAEMHGEEDFVKVLDFGIAKIMDQNDGEEAEALTSAGVLVGTLRYMAPEQIAGGEIGPQSDLYALGLIGVEMLTGQSVFAGTGRWEVLHKQISDDPVEIPESVRQSGMYEFFRRALAKNTQERFITADQMLKAIDALTNLGQAPVAEGGGVVSAESPISQSGPRSDVSRPVTRPDQVVHQTSTDQQRVPVAAMTGEATQLHPLPSESSATGGAVAEAPQARQTQQQTQQTQQSMQMNAGQPQAQRQPMHTPIPRQGAAFQTAPPGNFQTQQNPEHTGSFETDDGNKKLIAIGGILLLFIVLAAGAAFLLMPKDGSTVDDAHAATDTVDGTDEALVPPEVEPESPDTLETPPAADEETIEPTWVRLESGDVEAKVYAGDELLGTTPVRYPARETQILLVKAEGYEPKEIAIGPDSDEVVAIELAAIEKKEAPEKEPEVTREEKPATEKKPVRKPRETKPSAEEKPANDWIDVPTKKKKKEKKTDVPIF